MYVNLFGAASHFTALPLKFYLKKFSFPIYFLFYLTINLICFNFVHFIFLNILLNIISSISPPHPNGVVSSQKQQQSDLILSMAEKYPTVREVEMPSNDVHQITIPSTDAGTSGIFKFFIKHFIINFSNLWRSLTN